MAAKGQLLAQLRAPEVGHTQHRCQSGDQVVAALEQDRGGSPHLVRPERQPGAQLAHAHPVNRLQLHPVGARCLQRPHQRLPQTVAEPWARTGGRRPVGVQRQPSRTHGQLDLPRGRAARARDGGEVVGGCGVGGALGVVGLQVVEEEGVGLQAPRRGLLFGGGRQQLGAVEAPQGHRRVGRPQEALLGMLDEQATQPGVEPPRHGAARSQGGRLVVQVCVAEPVGGAEEGGVPLHQLRGQAAQGVQVGPRPHGSPLAGELLGRHVAGGAAHQRVVAGLAEAAGDAEVGEPYLLGLCIDEHVRRLQVEVHHPTRVGMGQGVEQGEEHPPGGGPVDPSAPAGQGAALHQLHGDPWAARLETATRQQRFGLPHPAGVEHVHHAGVVEVGRLPHLPSQRLGSSLAALGVAARPEHLHRDALPSAVVDGAPHFAHAAPPDALQQPQPPQHRRSPTLTQGAKLLAQPFLLVVVAELSAGVQGQAQQPAGEVQLSLVRQETAHSFGHLGHVDVGEPSGRVQRSDRLPQHVGRRSGPLVGPHLREGRQVEQRVHPTTLLPAGLEQGPGVVGRCQGLAELQGADRVVQPWVEGHVLADVPVDQALVEGPSLAELPSPTEHLPQVGGAVDHHRHHAQTPMLLGRLGEQHLGPGRVARHVGMVGPHAEGRRGRRHGPTPLREGVAPLQSMRHVGVTTQPNQGVGLVHPCVGFVHPFPVGPIDLRGASQQIEGVLEVTVEQRLQRLHRPHSGPWQRTEPPTDGLRTHQQRRHVALPSAVAAGTGVGQQRLELRLGLTRGASLRQGLGRDLQRRCRRPRHHQHVGAVDLPQQVVDRLHGLQRHQTTRRSGHVAHGDGVADGVELRGGVAPSHES
jgi:hypothetical protein